MLTRYDIAEDDVVPVTQEWVDEVQRVLMRKHMELLNTKDALAIANEENAKGFIARILDWAFPAKSVEQKYSPTAATDEMSDEQWNAIREEEEQKVGWTRNYVKPTAVTFDNGCEFKSVYFGPRV